MALPSSGVMRHLLIITQSLIPILLIECIVEGSKALRSTRGIGLSALKLFGPTISMRCLKSQDLGSLWTQAGFPLWESCIDDHV